MDMSKPAAPVETLKYTLANDQGNPALVTLTLAWDDHAGSVHIDFEVAPDYQMQNAKAGQTFERHPMLGYAESVFAVVIATCSEAIAGAFGGLGGPVCRLTSPPQ